MRFTKSCSWYFWKALDEEGCIGLVSWCLDLWCKSFKKYWIKFSLKMKLNQNWTFQRNWDVLLVLLERSWKWRFNGIYFIRFGIRMGEILNFKWFLSLKIQINHQNPQGLEGKISWKWVHTWTDCTGKH
jgi:hypothetical protein